MTRFHLHLTFLILSCLGCESQVSYRMRFIDNTTGKPVQGVQFGALQQGHHFNNRMFPALGKMTAPPSDENGETSLTLSHGDGFGYFLFVEKEGYQGITGDALTRGDWKLDYHASQSFKYGDDSSRWRIVKETRLAVSPSTTAVIELHPVLDR